MRRLFLLFVFNLLFVALSWAQQTKFDYIFQEAERQKLARNYDAAIDLFDHCRQLDPESGVVLYELADLYRYVKNDTLAIRALEKACKLYPMNYWYKDRLVSLYFENHRNDEALKHVEEMARLFPEKGEVLMMLLDLYEKKQDRENMVKVLDKIEVKEGKSEQLSMEKFRLFLQMNDEKRAFEEMKNLADEYPNDLRYQVVIGDLYLDAGKKEEALKQFKMVEEKDPENVTMLLSMANFQRQEGQDSLYQSYLERLLTNKSLDHAARVRMMAVIVRENLAANEDSTQVLNLFNKVLEEPQEETDLLEDTLRFQMAEKALEGVEGVKASDYEMHLPKPSYTWHTLQALAKDYPDCRFTLLIGGDNWAHFQQWYHWEDIQRMCDIAVYPREGFAGTFDAPLVNVSSTEIREKVKQGQSIQGLVPDSIVPLVEQYYK